MNRRSIVILLVVCLLFGLLTACEKPQAEETSQTDGKVKVITTIFPQYDFVRSIAGEHADIRMLLNPGADTHSFEPTPQDIIAIQSCDVFIYTGGESDEWLRELLSSMDTADIQVVSLMDAVALLEEEVVEGMQAETHDEHEHEEQEEHEEHVHTGEIEPEYDEHVWTSPKNAMAIVQRIADALCLADAENADTYRANTEAYIGQLRELDSEIQGVVQGAKRKHIVFGDRFPLRYFVEEYGLTYSAAFPGCSGETEASAATVAYLIDLVEREEIPVVFHLELSNQNIANAIGEATGAKVLQYNTCHNLTRADFDAGETYLSLMRKNIESLRMALN